MGLEAREIADLLVGLLSIDGVGGLPDGSVEKLLYTLDKLEDVQNVAKIMTMTKPSGTVARGNRWSGNGSAWPIQRT